MGWFGSEKARVPDTIGAKRMKDLQRRAQKAQKDSMFSKRQVDRRRADERQRGKSWWN